MGPPLAEAEHQRGGASVPGAGVGAQEYTARREGRPGETEEDGVSEFDDLEKKAEAYAEEHPEQAGGPGPGPVQHLGGRGTGRAAPADAADL